MWEILKPALRGLYFFYSVIASEARQSKTPYVHAAVSWVLCGTSLCLTLQARSAHSNLIQSNLSHPRACYSFATAQKSNQTKFAVHGELPLAKLKAEAGCRVGGKAKFKRERLKPEPLNYCNLCGNHIKNRFAIKAQGYWGGCWVGSI